MQTDSWTIPNDFSLAGIILPGFEDYFSFPVLNITTDFYNETSFNDRSLADQPDIFDPSDESNSLAFPNSGSKLFSIFAIGLAGDKLPSMPDVRPGDGWVHDGDEFADLVAFECALQFCVNKMSAQFLNGILIENVMEQWIDESQHLDVRATESRNYTLTPPWSNTNFVILDRTDASLKNWTGTMDYIWNSTTTKTALYRAMRNSTSGFPDLMDNLAKAMTHNLRTVGYQPSAIGNACRQTGKATVTWAWLAWPIFMFVASLALLVVVMVETRKRGLQPWTNINALA
ncbi:hypothetical protein EJ04DRAFT_571400 [Polyplosphaeria fusca]|uniref:Uncharacterized protein n=1 Tax=Polyplosphaeria fusca TaxID=682080 RepID=A0A9P4V623_9PLEO|nr:hypothetical protein EJ04DRAFT_571400 [Polyplosphaeria fusca]